MEQSSFEAYQRLLPVITAREQVILSWMIIQFDRSDMPPPWTANEIKHLMALDNYTARESWKRLNGMWKLGIVLRLPKRQCRVRPGHALEWTLSLRVPSVDAVQSRKKAAVQLDPTTDVGLLRGVNRVLIEIRSLRSIMMKELAPARQLSMISRTYAALDKILKENTQKGALPS